MQPFRIVKFRSGLAVTFTSPGGTRHRFALTAKNKKDATPEAVEIVTEFFKKAPSEITTYEVCEAYRVSLGDRPTARRMGANTALLKFFGPQANPNNRRISHAVSRDPGALQDWGACK